MKTSTQITLGVQIGAGLFAIDRGDALAAFLAFTSATATYFAAEEAALAEEREALTNPAHAKVSAIVGSYLGSFQKGVP